MLLQVKFPESVTSDVRDGMGTDPSDPLQATRLAQLLALLLPLALMLVLLSGAATYSQQAVRDGTRQQRVRTEAELQDAARDVICYASRKQQQLMGQSSSVQVHDATLFRRRTHWGALIPSKTRLSHHPLAQDVKTLTVRSLGVMHGSSMGAYITHGCTSVKILEFQVPTKCGRRRTFTLLPTAIRA